MHCEKHAFSAIGEDNKSSKGLMKTIKYLFGFKHYHSCVTEGFNATLLRKDNGSNRHSWGVVIYFTCSVSYLYCKHNLQATEFHNGTSSLKDSSFITYLVARIFLIVFLLRVEGCKMTSDALLVFAFTASLLPHFVE